MKHYWSPAYSWCDISVYAWFHLLLKSNVQVYLMRRFLLSPFQDCRPILGRFCGQHHCLKLLTIWCHHFSILCLWFSVVNCFCLAQCFCGAGKWGRAGKVRIVKFHLCRQWNQQSHPKGCKGSELPWCVCKWMCSSIWVEVHNPKLYLHFLNTCKWIQQLREFLLLLCELGGNLLNFVPFEHWSTTHFMTGFCTTSPCTGKCQWECMVVKRMFLMRWYLHRFIRGFTEISYLCVTGKCEDQWIWRQRARDTSLSI